MTRLQQTEEGHESSRVIRFIIFTAQRFLASRNQIELLLLELADLVGTKIGRFSPTQYIKVCQLKVNNNWVM